jgi:hypothetical protein
MSIVEPQNWDWWSGRTRAVRCRERNIITVIVAGCHGDGRLHGIEAYVPEILMVRPITAVKLRQTTRLKKFPRASDLERRILSTHE